MIDLTIANNGPLLEMLNETPKILRLHAGKGSTNTEVKLYTSRDSVCLSLVQVDGVFGSLNNVAP